MWIISKLSENDKINYYYRVYNMKKNFLNHSVLHSPLSLLGELNVHYTHPL